MAEVAKDIKVIETRVKIYDGILFCSKCDKRHIDEGIWATKPHHTHLCAYCGHRWRVEPYTRGI